MSRREARERVWSRLTCERARGTVVLVDPDDSWRGAARTELEGAGFGVIEAGTALEAVQSMSGRRVEVVATNYPMRLPSGRPLARVLHENALPGLVLVAVTARQAVANFQSAAADGCQAVVLKPVHPEALVDLVDLLTRMGHAQAGQPGEGIEPILRGLRAACAEPAGNAGAGNGDGRARNARGRP